MKKLLFTLFLSLLTLTMSAQIQRTFLGCTLGVSTPAQVKANMAQKGYRPSDTSNKGCYIYDNINFAGFSNTQAFFYFYKNKLYLVSFILDHSFLGDSFDTKIDLLRERLLEKYSSYVCKSDYYDFVLNDNKTTNTLKRIFLNETGLYMLTLMYMDDKLLDEKEKSNSDEL